jgi:hypothetical protein
MFHDRQEYPAGGEDHHRYDKYVSSDAMPAGTFAKEHCDKSRQHSQGACDNVEK